MNNLYDYSREKFISKLYSDLHDTDSVKNISLECDKKEVRIRKYLEYQENLINRCKKNNHIDYLYSLYHEKYCVKKENVRYNYENIRKKQEESMDKWLNYLLDETTIYPMWFKYFVFQKMLKIGNYDEATGTYNKRRHNTISPFIECNPEVIAKIYDLYVKSLDNMNINNKNLEELIKNGSFEKLYAFFIKENKEIELHGDINDGIWIKYNEGNILDAKKLCASLEGKNTGWCTASEIKAIEQICGSSECIAGNFYVYYTKDIEGKYTMPRIAIKMNGNINIGEIRGIEEAQNIEEGFEDIIIDKLNNIPNIDEEEKKKKILACNDSKKLTFLAKKVKNNIPLTEEEQIFIFELNRDIASFSWFRDKRIDRIRENIKIENLDIAKKAIKQNEYYFFCIDDAIKEKKEFMLEAVKSNSMFLSYASERLRRDKDITIAAVKKSGFALEYVHEIYKRDKEVIIEALKNNPLAIKYIPDDLKKNPDFSIEINQIISQHTFKR